MWWWRGRGQAEDRKSSLFSFPLQNTARAHVPMTPPKQTSGVPPNPLAHPHGMPESHPNILDTKHAPMPTPTFSPRRRVQSID